VSPVTLPLLNVQLPIVEFYVVVPWLLLLLYFNLLLHLTFLAQRLHRLNAVLAAFSDEATRAEQRLRLFPFPFSALLIGHLARGAKRGAGRAGSSGRILDNHGRAWKTGRNPTEKSGHTHGPVPAMIDAP